MLSKKIMSYLNANTVHLCYIMTLQKSVLTAVSFSFLQFSMTMETFNMCQYLKVNIKILRKLIYWNFAKYTVEVIE